jgi:antitoxin (DNA-binding transcriptional repressor) of toxin-antitoxin stability system
MEGMQSVSVREFRANLHKYTRQSSEPIAITSHGEAIGYFVPAKPHPDQQDIAALQEAVRKITALLEAQGVSEEEIIADFQAIRVGD